MEEFPPEWSLPVLAFCEEHQMAITALGLGALIFLCAFRLWKIQRPRPL
jgi:hypothetical protein